MSLISVPYSRTNLELSIPDPYRLEYILPKELAPAEKPLDLVQQALSNPLGTKRLHDFRGVKSVAIAINDKTRPIPHTLLLPPLLDTLEAIGIAKESITFLIATGIHTVMPPEDYGLILPDGIIQNYRILCHDHAKLDDLAYLGKTARDTPIHANRHFIEADLRIVVGNIEAHHFMGFSGGVKSAAIGLVGKETIQHNHAMMLDEYARLGEYELNPMRQDIEEIGQILRVDFALNTLLNREKQIVDVFWGEPVAVMHAGIPRVRASYEIEVEAPLDLLILSAGGYPKDINIYQAQKSLSHAMPVMKQGATVIWCAACEDGTGSKAYEEWILNERIQSQADVFKYFEQEGFHVGPHKALQLARNMRKVNLMVYSVMDAAFVKSLHLQPIEENLQIYLNTLLQHLNAHAKIGFMPHGNVTMPRLKPME